MENLNNNQEDFGTMPLTEKPNLDKEKVMEFYKKGLPQILKTFFYEPISGTYGLLSEKSEAGFLNSIFLIVTTAVIYMLLPYMMMGEYRSMAGGFGTTFKMGLAIALLMVIVSVVAFGIKSVSGKPVFKNELLTGALCGIPLSIILIVVFAVSLFTDINPMRMAFGGMGSLKSAGILVGVFAFYTFLMLINILQQSLKAGGTKDAMAWYLSPIGILLAFFITQKLGSAFIGN